MEINQLETERSGIRNADRVLHEKLLTVTSLKNFLPIDSTANDKANKLNWVKQTELSTVKDSDSQSG